MEGLRGATIRSPSRQWACLISIQSPGVAGLVLLLDLPLFFQAIDKRGSNMMCPFYYSFLNQCVVKGQSSYSPFSEQRLVYCMADEYTLCDRYRLFFEGNIFPAMDRRSARRKLKQYSGYLLGPSKKAYIETVDISSGGMRVSSSAYLPEKHPVSIALNDENGNRIQLSGRVCWTGSKTDDGRWELGIKFNYSLDTSEFSSSQIMHSKRGQK